ncbi:MAG: T9SS type A sorting domain-containing protein [Bacteroidales bacterium]|nr:T9SS type A sorting domain-containing protein [Bacteroidales bacterium]
MLTQKIKTLAFSTIYFFSLLGSSAQIQIETGVSLDELMKTLKGPGILDYTDVYMHTTETSVGIFTGADSFLLGMSSGIVFCTGDVSYIPGPNSISNAGIDNGLPGDPTLSLIGESATSNASTFAFEFIPLNDTLRISFVFGSEEYNEHVGSIYNDICGIFLTGPKPAGGNYVDSNIGIIPETEYIPVNINNLNNGHADPGEIPSGPCNYCQYFSDNTNGSNLEYDAFSTKLTGLALVIPNEEYYIKIAVADGTSAIWDSGLFLEAQSFNALGPAQFTSFNFLKEDNPQLPFDIIGTIGNFEVHLEVPAGTGLSNLVASFTETGAYVFVSELPQVSGETTNDFSNPLVYHLKGYEEKDWTIYLEIVTGTKKSNPKDVVIFPNPAKGSFTLTNVKGVQVKIMDISGYQMVLNRLSIYENTIDLNDLQAGIYIVELNTGNVSLFKKIIVY